MPFVVREVVSENDRSAFCAAKVHGESKEVREKSRYK